MIDVVSSINRLHQVIQEPAHILNSSSSYIDLISTSQPNLVMESGVHSSLHPDFYHEKVNLKVSLSILYLSSYERQNMLIENSKQGYYSKLSSKLVNSATSSKTYWSILKIFLNNKKNSLYTFFCFMKTNL